MTQSALKNQILFRLPPCSPTRHRFLKAGVLLDQRLKFGDLTADNVKACRPECFVGDVNAEAIGECAGVGESR
jgi:hypothetical protein